MVVEPPQLKNMSQNGFHLPQISGWTITNIWVATTKQKSIKSSSTTPNLQYPSTPASEKRRSLDRVDLCLSRVHRSRDKVAAFFLMGWKSEASIGSDTMGWWKKSSKPSGMVKTL